jgi:hypothetical protein
VKIEDVADTEFLTDEQVDKFGSAREETLRRTSPV